MGQRLTNIKLNPTGYINNDNGHLHFVVGDLIWLGVVANNAKTCDTNKSCFYRGNFLNFCDDSFKKTDPHEFTTAVLFVQAFQKYYYS